MVSPEQPEDTNYDAADPDQSTHDGAGLNEHGPIKSGFQAGWLLQSDNRNKQAWPTRPWPDEAKIVSKVKWLGRTFT